MANVKVAGNAVVITSTIPFDDLKKIEKCKPEALILKGGEDGKEQLFRIGTNEDRGFYNANSMAFDGKTHDDNGFATLTLTNIKLGDDVPKAILEHLGGPLTYLNQLEKKLPDVLAEVRDAEAKILANVDIAI